MSVFGRLLKYLAYRREQREQKLEEVEINYIDHRIILPVGTPVQYCYKDKNTGEEVVGRDFIDMHLALLPMGEHFYMLRETKIALCRKNLVVL